METNQGFFGRQLRKIMAEKQITQTELADKLGVYQTMISHWLTGIKNPKLSSVKKLADALDVPASYFLDENSAQNNVQEGKNSANTEILLKIQLLEEKNKRYDIEINNLKEKNEILERKLKMLENR